MAAIDNAKRHFKAFDRCRIEVAEWGDDPEHPLVIYAKPMTLADKQHLRGWMEEFGQVEALANLVIRKAEDGDGKKLFTLGHKRDFMHEVDPDVVARIAGKMTAAPSVAEMEKN